MKINVRPTQHLFGYYYALRHSIRPEWASMGSLDINVPLKAYLHDFAGDDALKCGPQTCNNTYFFIQFTVTTLITQSLHLLNTITVLFRNKCFGVVSNARVMYG